MEMRGNKLVTFGTMPRGDKGPKQYEVGRVCATEGCDTVLSRYNPGTHCGACDDPREMRRPHHNSIWSDR